MKAPHELTATQARRALESNNLTSEALVHACIERIQDRESTVHAWVETNFTAALAAAKAADRSSRKGPLHGIPFGAKDLFDTYDFPTRYGSPIYQNNQPMCDAVHIALMRQAGGILLGKTVTTEFATFKGGPTANPHNPQHTPGGSSSGSAAAVADYMVPIATGSQTAGSVIRPASFCGVVGYKPTYGKISTGGSKSLSPSLDTLGCFARSVEDAALSVATMTGDFDLANVPEAPKSIRIATCLTPDANQASSDTIMAIEHAALLAEDHFKHPVKNIRLPKIFSKLAETQSRVMWAESAKSFAFEQAMYSDQLSQQIKGLLKLGSAISYEQYSADLIEAEQARHAIDQLLTQSCDILITPSAIGEAPAGLTQTGDPIFCRIWTLLGLPCINLPLSKGSNGLSVGIQLVGARGKDRLLLSVAQALMS